MRKTESNKPFDRVGYYPLQNNYADVFMHKNEIEKIDEDGNIVYIADELYFQIDKNTTKEDIENNFEYMWEDVQKDKSPQPSDNERIKSLEDALLSLLGGV